MLEFIVLGLVPGTNLQITFGQFLNFVLIGGVIGLSAYELRYHYSHKSNHKFDRMAL